MRWSFERDRDLSLQDKLLGCFAFRFVLNAFMRPLLWERRFFNFAASVFHRGKSIPKLGVRGGLLAACSIPGISMGVSVSDNTDASSSSTEEARQSSCSTCSSCGFWSCLAIRRISSSSVSLNLLACFIRSGSPISLKAPQIDR